jgi:transcriptional regulator with XRE-family HTH domain
MKDLDSIGTKIRNLREVSEMPLRKLAALLDIDQSTLSKIERDERKPNVKLIKQISELFNAEMDDLLIALYSDLITYKIQDETTCYEILKVAEAKIKYNKEKKNG